MRRAARWLYDLCIEAFPRQHRRDYGAEMLDAFDRELSARRGVGMWRAVWFVFAACLNAVVTGFSERFRHYRFEALMSRLDFTLAWRILKRYPGLSVIGTFGMAVGIAIAAVAFTISNAVSSSDIPLEEGERVVSLMQWDTATSNREQRLIHDYVAWKDLTSIDDVSIARTTQRNLIVEGRAPEVVTVAEISASAFAVTRVAPLRGRVLLPEDEHAGAPDAVVIGHREWVRRFNADPDILGKSLQLGGTSHQIVGVMPEGFAFPLFHHYWIPWRLNTQVYGPRRGPSVDVFGRLAAGATIESATAELATIGERAAASMPETHQHLQPRVVPFAHAFNAMDDPQNAVGLFAMQVSIVLLLIVVCVNVSILVYARTATRLGEIAVRTALGASRRRIVSQLFVEALLLAGIAGIVGVGIATAILNQLEGATLIIAGGALPFWMTLRLSLDGTLYIVALTLMAAAIIGVAPAVKATASCVQARLQTLSAGSGSRMQMGRVWTALIVAQIAFTVAILPAAMYHAWTSARFRIGHAGFEAGEYLTAQMLLDRTIADPTDDGEREFTARFGAAHRELARRLQERPEVRDITYSIAAVGEESAVVIEVEGHDSPADPVDYNMAAGSRRGYLAHFNRVAPNFFHTFEVPVLMGRDFQDADAGAAGTAAAVAIVNRAMVDQLFSGENPLGRRLRYVGRSHDAGERNVTFDRWYEIVGVVPDFPETQAIDNRPILRVYHPAAFGEVYPAELSMRIRGNDPTAFAGTFRETGAAVDPNVQIRDIATSESVMLREQGLMRLIGAVITAVLVSVIALSAAGIYALMSFTVARRKREIGIRAALGADRNRLLAGIFSRALIQLGAGAAAGMLGAVALEQVLQGEMFQGQGAVLLPATAAVVIVMGVASAIGPARRGLSIQPTEALREE